MIALIALIVLLLLGLSYAKTQSPEAVDWTPSFINTKTSPYGTYITYHLLDDIFDKKNIRTTRVPIYNNLKDNLAKYISYPEEGYTYDDSLYESEDYDDEYEESSVADTIEMPDNDTIVHMPSVNPTDWYHQIENIQDTTSYIFINTAFVLEKLDLEYMLDFVGLGNNIFISAERFDNKLMDTLRISMDRNYFSSDSIFTLNDFAKKEYRFGSINNQTKLDTDSCLFPVRTLATNNKNDTVFVEVTYGKGHIYLHTLPTAFANINMLQTNKYDFGFRSLSYLPQNSLIIWDEYQKQGAIGEGSDFRMMLTNPPLRIALYIILGGLLLFMLFRSKRTQRVIPVINPPVNSSLEFLDTISNLYHRHKDFNTIVEKRHAYFLDFIRKNYYLQTENIDKDFINILSAKTNIEKEKLIQIFELYKDMASLAYIPENSFLKYNSLLEEFYRSVKTNKT